MDVDFQVLNEQFAVPGHVSFSAGPGGLLMAAVNNRHAAATMTLAGGHVMTYALHGEQPVLWVSPNVSYTVGMPMRGGVPVCWPWFATHPDDPWGKPLHGLVRTMLWSVAGARELEDGSTEVRMLVHDNAETLAIWPHPFELEVIATIGPRLRVEWRARNPGDQPYTYTGALHPYYAVSDISSVTVTGLEGVDYLDKVDEFKRKTQAGSLRFTECTDRIYLDTTAEVVIEDPGLGRAIHIAKEGSRTTVVWNPADKDALIPGMLAGQHRGFVCVEAANAVDDVTHVAPGGEGCLAMEIWTETLR